MHLAPRNSSEIWDEGTRRTGPTHRNSQTPPPRMNYLIRLRSYPKLLGADLCRYLGISAEFPLSGSLFRFIQSVSKLLGG